MPTVQPAPREICGFGTVDASCLVCLEKSIVHLPAFERFTNTRAVNTRSFLSPAPFNVLALLASCTLALREYDCWVVSGIRRETFMQPTCASAGSALAYRTSNILLLYIASLFGMLLVVATFDCQSVGNAEPPSMLEASVIILGLCPNDSKCENGLAAI